MTHDKRLSDEERINALRRAGIGEELIAEVLELQKIVAGVPRFDPDAGSANMIIVDDLALRFVENSHNRDSWLARRRLMRTIRKSVSGTRAHITDCPACRDQMSYLKRALKFFFDGPDVS